MTPASKLRRYRANVNTAGLSAGEVVEIDPNVPTWRELIDAGWLTEDTSDALPDPEAYLVGELGAKPPATADDAPAVPVESDPAWMDTVGGTPARENDEDPDDNNRDRTGSRTSRRGGRRSSSS